MKKWIITIALAVLLLSLLISLSAQMRRAAAAEHDLREATLLALSEAAEEMQSAVLAMDKLRIAAKDGQSAVFISQIAQHADRARHALAALPNEEAQLTPVLTWLSRLTALAEDDLSALMTGLPVHHEDLLARQSDLHLLHTELDLARQELLSGADLSAVRPTSALTAAPTAAELAAYRGLPATTIGSGQALQVAKAFVGEERVRSVAHAPDTTGALPAFGVTVQTQDVQLNLEVTARGGKVLMMVPETAGFPVRKTVSECRDAADAFLKSRGFAAMESPYYQVYNGLCVLTFVHVQDDVLVWADRVTVQVRMDTAEVVGLEARSYWQHHTPRKIIAPLLSESEARTSLSPSVTVLSARKCLLPLEGRERLCWQFTLSYGDDTYISYIDAITGREVLLEKVMQLETGAVAA